MSKGKNDYHFYIDGQAVPVSEEVYQASKHFERKEEYFTYDLKQKNLVRKWHPFSQAGKTTEKGRLHQCIDYKLHHGL